MSVLPIIVFIAYFYVNLSYFSDAVFKPNVNLKTFSLVSYPKEAYNVQKPINYPHEKVKTGSHKLTMTSSDDVNTATSEENISNSNSTTSFNTFFAKQGTANKPDLDLQLQNCKKHYITLLHSNFRRDYISHGRHLHAYYIMQN